MDEVLSHFIDQCNLEIGELMIKRDKYEEKLYTVRQRLNELAKKESK